MGIGQAFLQRSICYRPYVCLSVCHTSGSVKKRLKLGLCNFHRSVVGRSSTHRTV